MLTDEGMRNAAIRAEQAEAGIRSAAGFVDETARRLEVLFADGYGGNALKLIELLEAGPSAEIARLESSNALLARKVAAHEQALAPSTETKAAYMGEFSVPLPDLDENGEECMRRINVPWTTIKEIMGTIAQRALEAAKVGGEKDE